MAEYVHTVIRKFLDISWTNRLFPSSDLAHMRLISSGDLPYIVLLPKIWLNTVLWLRQARQKLKGQTWYDLSSIYPRFIMFGYIYQLHFFVRYTGIVDKFFRKPDGAIIAELFLRYICEIDEFVDQFDSRELLSNNWTLIRAHPQAKLILKDLMQRLQGNDIPEETYRRILQAIAAYRMNYYASIKHWSQDPAPNSNLNFVMTNKIAISGRLMPTWALILGYFYGVEHPLLEEIETIFYRLALYIQLIDDLVDLPGDYKVNSENIVLAVIGHYPDEHVALKTYLAKKQPAYFYFSSLKKLGPCAYIEIQDMRASFLRELQSSIQKSSFRQELTLIIERFFIYQV
jgi:hypothetical protein